MQDTIYVFTIIYEKIKKNDINIDIHLHGNRFA